MYLSNATVAQHRAEIHRNGRLKRVTKSLPWFLLHNKCSTMMQILIMGGFCASEQGYTETVYITS